MPDVDTTKPHKSAPELDLVPLAKFTRITVQRLAPFCQIRLPCASFFHLVVCSTPDLHT